MVRIAWRMLAQRPASMVATFVALWFAVAMVTACGAMLESGLRFHGPVDRYAAAPVLVATTDVRTTEGSGEDRDTETLPLVRRGPLPPSLRDRIAAAPGVRAAISDVAVPTQVTVDGGGAAGAAGEIHAWSAAALTPFSLRAGAAPTNSRDAVLDRDLAEHLGVRPGQAVRLGLASGTRTVHVTGIVAPTGAAPETPTIFVPDREAAVVAGNSVEVIAALPERRVSTSALAAAVGKVMPQLPESPAGSYPRVFTGAARGSAESPAVDDAREFAIVVSSVFGGATLLIGALVIAGTVGLSVRQRHRDIALLRAIAATPRQVRRMVIREAAALGVLAAAAGVWPGLAGASWLRDQLAARGMVPDSFAVRLSWLPPTVAATAALLIGIVAAWVASLRASRIRPTEALAETAVERGGIGVVRAALGLVALAGGITLCVVSASITGGNAAGVSVGTVFTLVVAVALLSPVLIRAAAMTVGRLLGLSGVTGRLAAANIGTSARGLAPVVSSLVLAVALGGSLWFVQTSAEHVATEQTHAGVRADYFVTPPAPGLQPGVVAALRHTDGVVAATGIVRSALFASDSGLNNYSALGVDVAGLTHTLDLGVTKGRLADLRAGTVAVDTLTADALGLKMGGRFRGWFGDGRPAILRVVAIYERGLGFASLTLPRDVLVRHTSSGLDQAAFVATDPGRPHAAATLRRVLAHHGPGAAVVPRAAYQAGLDKDLRQNAWTNKVVTGVLLVYVVIAAVNTLIMSALGRRREFGILRLSGTTRPQVLRMVRLERVLLLGLALLVGAGIAAGTLIPMVKGITGSATPYIPLAGWVSVIGGVIVLGSLASVIPVRRVLRMRPVEAIGIRE